MTKSLQDLAHAYYGLNVTYGKDKSRLRLTNRVFHIHQDMITKIWDMLEKIAYLAFQQTEELYAWSGWEVIPPYQRLLDLHLLSRVPCFLRLDYTLAPDGTPCIYEFDNNPWGREFTLALQNAMDYDSHRITDVWPHENPLVIHGHNDSCWDSLPYFLEEVGGKQMRLSEFEVKHIPPSGVVERYFRFNMEDLSAKERVLIDLMLEDKIQIEPVPNSLLSKILFAILWDTSLDHLWKRVELPIEYIRTIIPETKVLTPYVKEKIVGERKEWVVKYLDHSNEACAKGVFVGKYQRLPKWKTILTESPSYAIACRYRPHLQEVIPSIGPDFLEGVDELSMLFRAFIGKGIYLGGNTLAGKQGPRGGKIHGGDNIAMGILTL